MINGLLGRKLAMTQIFDADGNVIPVTVIEAGPCVVLGQIDSPRKKVKVGFEPVKESRLTKPELGYFKKLGVSPLRCIKEFEDIEDDASRVKAREALAANPEGEKSDEKAEETPKEEKKADEKAQKTDASAEEPSEEGNGYKVGEEVTVDMFLAGDFVNVSGISIGKGFQGGMKRWHWSGGPAGHGSMHHRRVGSIGASAYPSRTFKGRHMPGQLGSQKATVQNLRVVDVDATKNLVWVEGGIPGSKNSLVTITLSKKKKFRSLQEQKAVHVHKRNPMKQSKSKAKGK